MTATEAPTLEQLPLFPERLLTLGPMELVPLTRLPDDALLEGPPPSAKLIESIRRWGVLEPVLVRAVGGALDYGNPATLVSGRRRIKAVRRLQAEFHARVRMHAGSVPAGTELSEATSPGYRAAYERYRDFQRIPVRVISDPEGVVGDGRTDALLLTTNAVRADNPVADLRAVLNLFDRFVKAGVSEKGAVGEVAAATGLAVGTVKQRLRLLRLSGELLDDFYAGRLPYPVALAASALGPESQARFALMIDGGQQPTLLLVKRAKRDAVRQFQADLLADLPEPGEPTGDWRDPRSTRRAAELIVDLRATRIPLCIEAADMIAALAEEAQSEH